MRHTKLKLREKSLVSPGLVKTTYSTSKYHSFSILCVARLYPKLTGITHSKRLILKRYYL